MAHLADNSTETGVADRPLHCGLTVLLCMYVGPLALSPLHLVEVAWQGRAILPIRNGMLLDPGYIELKGRTNFGIIL